MSGRCQVDVRFTCYAEVQERGEIMEIYKEVIIQAVIIFPVVAALFTMPYMLYNYHKYGSVLSMRILIVYSFILYLLCAYFLVILPLPSMEEVAAMTGPRASCTTPFISYPSCADIDTAARHSSSWTVSTDKIFFIVYPELY